ncbi:MAG: helix-turn-helix domain-containing protein [Chloroflexota bacterium]
MTADRGAAFISIREASRMLGVSEATLRQWTDRGQVKAFITPGGHRRYSLAELKRLLVPGRKMHRIGDIVAELQGTSRLHGVIGRKSLQAAIGIKELRGESEEHFAKLGRRLLHLIIRCILEPSNRAEILEFVRDVGRDFGESMAKIGIPLADSVEAVILHRAPLIEATSHFIKKREVVDGSVVDAISLVARIMDEVLIAMVEAHQGTRRGGRSQSKGLPRNDINLSPPMRHD